MIKKKIITILTICSMALFFAIAPVSPVSQFTTVDAYAKHVHKYIIVEEIELVRKGYNWRYIYYECQNDGCDNEMFLVKKRLSPAS